MSKRLKSSTGSKSKTKDGDSSKAQLYQTRLAHMKERTPIPDRGVASNAFDFAWIIYIWKDRNWKQFLEHPSGPANVVIVREFYAAFLNPENDRVPVRGKRVLFTPAVINKHYGLADTYPEDDYTRFLDEGVDMAGVLSRLCQPDTRLEKDSQGKGHVARHRMRGIAQAWQLIVNSRVMPTGNVSQCTKDRLILIDCILENRSIDVGHLIHSMIVRCANDNRKTGLGFPHLITQICLAAGVQEDHRDVTETKGHVITVGEMERIHAWDSPSARESVSIEEHIPSLLGAPESSADPMTLILARLTEIHQQIARRDARDVRVFRYLDREQRAIAAHLSMPMDASPSLDDILSDRMDGDD